MKRVRSLGYALLLVMVVLAVAPMAAQDGGEIVISLAVPNFLEDIFSDELIAQFEAENPGVKVNIVNSDAAFMGSPTRGVENYLESMAEYAATADVVFIGADNLSPEATRAGYLLDLTPLTSADTSLNVDDFIPAAWQSFQWDRGIWALPVSVDVIVLIYNPEMFDRAGLPYPNASWTIEDFANAVRALTTTDEDGELQPAYVDYGNTEHLFWSLLGTPVYDSSMVPVEPDFSNPAIAPLLTQWQELLDEGVVQGMSGGGQIVMIGGGANAPAISIQQSFGLASFPNQNTALGGSLLPGGRAGLEAQGFGVSAGTQYPEQAYALVKFLTNSIDVADGLFGGNPARYSLMGMESSNNANGGSGGPRRALSNLQFSPENQAVIDAAYANAIPVSQMLFGDYLGLAVDAMTENGVDATSALADAELQAVNNLTLASQKAGQTTIAVATPAPAVVLNAGEIALNFGMTSFVSPLPNQDQWNQVIADFVANDAQVGQVVMDPVFQTELAAMATDYDCFYLPSNAVQDSDDLSPILPLDPYLDADPTFDKADVIGTALQQVQFNGKTWAYPIVIQPEVLRYNSELFQQAGVPLPENGWTMDAFVDALAALQSVIAEDAQPFVPQGFGSNYMTALIAAYGGLPLDYSTNPPTINFTDPATVNAIQQALNLVKAGYIKYEALAGGVGGVRAVMAFGNSEDTDAIQTYSLNGFNFGGGNMEVRVQGGAGPQADPYRYVAYPQGTQYTPVSYNVGTAYISATSQNPEACYRWLSTLAQHPELFSSMPARNSLLNSPTVVANTDPNLLALFNQVAAQLKQPNALNLPSGFRGTPETAFLQTWLNNAFDSYINDEADLLTELQEAEANAKTYQECASAVPPFDEASGQTQQEYFEQFIGCAQSVDPTLFP